MWLTGYASAPRQSGEAICIVILVLTLVLTASPALAQQYASADAGRESRRHLDIDVEPAVSEMPLRLMATARWQRESRPESRPLLSCPVTLHQKRNLRVERRKLYGLDERFKLAGRFTTVRQQWAAGKAREMRLGHGDKLGVKPLRHWVTLEIEKDPNSTEEIDISEADFKVLRGEG
jgi:hypothetical protein